MKIVLVRQRPSIGDCLLLSPVIRELKIKYPNSELVVITNNQYMAGALNAVFAGIEGVDRVESISPYVWTTASNKAVDSTLAAVNGADPLSVASADLVLDANGGFILLERDHAGTPPYGISEFWLKHFNLYVGNMSILPEYHVPAWAKTEVDAWLPNGNYVGIILKSGHICRDWDYGNKSARIADWLYTRGITPIGIDPVMAIDSDYAISCIGKRLPFVAEVIRRCKFVLTPDTGMVHLAQAVGTRTVSMWGIMPPILRTKGYDTITIPENSRGVCGKENYNCECQWPFQRWSCMRRITLTDIIQGCEKALIS